MQSVENACCIISVHSLDTGKRLSCSGTIISRTGIVLCSGVLFRFLEKENWFSSNKSFILPGSSSRNLDIRVRYHEPNVGMNECSALSCVRERPVSSHNAELLILVNCPEFRSAFRSVFRETDKWSLIESEDSEVRNFDVLSWFAVLTVPYWNRSNTIPHVRSGSLKKGCTVIACGSPFGSQCPDLFMSTLSKGIVSNLYGEDNVVILTDARCLPGTEGGGVFVEDGRHVYLVGLIVAPLCWKSSDWIGLTLVCSLHAILRNIQQSAMVNQAIQQCVGNISNNEHQLGLLSSESLVKNPTVALVQSGQFWGSGILYKHRLILTCRHVVDGKSVVKVKFYVDGRFHTMMGDVVFSTEASSPYDIAVVQLKTDPPYEFVPQFASFFQPGEDVIAIAYGVFGGICGPSMTSGILSRVVTHKSRPVMLQTTCAVQAGASGGAVVRADTGELLGLVSSNTRDFTAEVTYPHLNFSIPVTVLEPLLKGFAVTGDAEVFEDLNRIDKGVRTIWRLQNTQSKL
ncbi:peroxisomal leader peptide-processing protease [Alosa sapidissima]|uniref:peroxisomal leader peptide-processing protease n=1 Tax=Alosa sapidissima TaxID=34773 RepID=UPI001C0A0869|nr:peroxisomal leader peptide-processing protease [Alosa sapidissima]